MSDWRLAKAIDTLRKQVNLEHPNRPEDADGTIGDEAHRRRKSDHNPVAPHPGVVTAWDITTADFTDELAEQLRRLIPKDGRVKYVIYKGRITTPEGGWKPYDGADDHMGHIHLSLSNDPDQYDRTDPWPVLGKVKPDTPKGEPDMVIIYAPGEPTALLTGGRLVPLKSNAEKDALQAAGVPVKRLTTEQFQLIEAVAGR